MIFRISRLWNGRLATLALHDHASSALQLTGIGADAVFRFSGNDVRGLSEFYQFRSRRFVFVSIYT